MRGLLAVLALLLSGFAAHADPCIQLRAADITCAGTHGCAGETIDGTSHGFVVADFSQAADQSGSWNFPVPEGWTGVPATVEIEWMSNHGDCNDQPTDDVCWVFDSGSVADGGPWVAATLGGVENGQNDRCTRNGALLRARRTGYVHGMTDGQLGIFVLTRDVSGTPRGCASEDDYTQAAKVVAVRLCREQR